MSQNNLVRNISYFSWMC